MPEVPGFPGDIKTDSSIKTIMGAQYRTINRGGHSIHELVHKAGYDACVKPFRGTLALKIDFLFTHFLGRNTSDSTICVLMIG
jgi:hypothetical protein